MLSKRRFLTLVLIGSGIASAACSLITDVDRSKIEGSGGSDTGGSSSVDDSGTETGGGKATGGGSSHGTGGSNAHDAGDASD
jgi:hypothetical protein